MIMSLEDANFKFNARQQSVLTSFFQTYGSFGIVEGVTGCGKSHIIAAISWLYVQCGGNVRVSVPSNAAGDAFASKT